MIEFDPHLVCVLFLICFGKPITEPDGIIDPSECPANCTCFDTGVDYSKNNSQILSIRCLGGPDSSFSISRLQNFTLRAVSIENATFVDVTIKEGAPFIDVEMEGLIISGSHILAKLSLVRLSLDSYKFPRRLRAITIVDSRFNIKFPTGPLADEFLDSFLGLFNSVENLHIDSTEFIESDGSLPNYFHHISQERMRYVTVANCRLRDINATYLSWPNLETLDLSGNELTTLDREWLAPKLNNLLMLDLSHNNLTTVPNGFFVGMPALTHLYLNENSIVSLSFKPFVDVWLHLKILMVYNNSLLCEKDICNFMGADYTPFIFGETNCDYKNETGVYNIMFYDYDENYC